MRELTADDLETIHESKMYFESQARHYTAMMTVDLLNHIFVEQRWGGKFNRRGNGKRRPVESVSQGLALLEAIGKRRRQRGYTLGVTDEQRM